MRQLVRFFIPFFFSLWAIHAEAQAANLDTAIKVIRSFYKESEANIDAGEFSGRYFPEKRCRLLKKYFSTKTLKDGGAQLCKLPPLLTRYPGYELNFEGSYDPAPKYKIVTTSINDERAEIAIEMMPSDEKRDFVVARTEWVLRFSDNGWLIYGARICDSYVSQKNAEILKSRHNSTFGIYRCTDFGEPPLGPNLTPN
ncbi:hypothetical protein [Dechloromonas denitrificans]|uniref:hypothetical protein n=1 Tax=Dechloromonas denitrificans TaxID=281362 RepID=UPI0012FBFDD2|nr:hypothetical protein [Dechloromonas denitrificans]